MPDVGKPRHAVVLDAKAELVVLLQCNESGFGHEMFVYRPERATGLDPDISRAQPVTKVSLASRSRKVADLLSF
ncbi:hypothetical protein ASC96_30455 [Rhizobium sp. Root1204]|nr:hypothetical protein ASC96_30455 [Rhizobium sp. Root1204]